MMADWLFKALLAQYALATLAYAVEGRWLMALYFLGATALNVAVLMLGGK